jgi:hypothetical protein
MARGYGGYHCTSRGLPRQEYLSNSVPVSNPHG